MAHLRMVDESEVEDLRWAVGDSHNLMRESVIVAGIHPRFGWCCVELDIAIDRRGVTIREEVQQALARGKELVRAGVTDAEYSHEKEI